MKKWANLQEEKGRTTKITIERKRKKTYRSPRLVVYGDLNRLTMGGGGRLGDHGGHSRA